jgi:hypothetical protein
MQDSKPIVRNIQTNDVYEWQHSDTYQNLRTGAIGEVKPEVATKCFVINVPLSVLVGEFPELKMFINKLDLRLDNSIV